MDSRRMTEIILVPRVRDPFGQHQESIHGLPVIWHKLGVKFDKSDWFWSQSIVGLQSHSKPECRWTRPEVAIIGADQKERVL